MATGKMRVLPARTPAAGEPFPPPQESADMSPQPPRRSSRSRWLLGLALPVVVPVVLPLAGCDSPTDKADRQAQMDMDQAAGANLSTPAGRADAHQALDAAANKEPDASPAVQMRANALLADDELRQARQIAAAVSANDAEIDRLLGEAAQLTAAVGSDNQIVAAINKYQPDPVLAAFKDASSSMTGTDDKPDWRTTDSGPLASMAATDKAATALQQQIDQLQQKIKGEQDQRADLAGKADAAQQQADRAKGPEALQLYTTAADTRKQADDINAQVDQDQSALAHAQSDLAVQQAASAATKEGIGKMDQGQSATNDAWTELTGIAQKVKDQATAVLGDAASAPPPAAMNKAATGPATIAAKAAQIDALRKKNAPMRQEAEAHFNKAIGAYKDAYDRATAVQSALATPARQERPERTEAVAWGIEKDADDPAGFRYLQAAAQLGRAQFYSRAAAEARAVATLSTAVKTALDTAGLKPPAGLDDPDTDANAAQKDAKAAVDGFTAAVDNLDKITQGNAPPELKAGANLSTAFADYGLYLEAVAAGDANAQLLLDKAQAARGQAASGGMMMPPMPSGLASSAAGGAGGPADTTAGGATMTVASMAGTYSGTGPIDGPNSPSALQTLVLTADGQFTVSVVLPAPIGKHVQAGTFTVAGNKMTLVAKTLDGKPAAAADVNKPTVATIEDNGRRLTQNDGSAPLTRQP